MTTPMFPEFDGSTYDPEHDRTRLTGQLAKVYACMKDGQWRTIPEISAFVPEASRQGISARLRDLRKPKFGGYLVEKRRRGEPKNGVWEYRMLLTRGTQAKAPERLTKKDMEQSLEALRGTFKRYPEKYQPALAKLGRWLAANIEGAK